MKTINLPALTQITFEEIGGFLSWLENQPASAASLAQMQKSPPIRTSKLNPMLKTLEQFGFISQKQGRFSLIPRGTDYLHSEISVRKAVLKTLFTQIDWVQKIAEAVQAAPTDRIHRAVINDEIQRDVQDSDRGVRGACVHHVGAALRAVRIRPKERRTDPRANAHSSRSAPGRAEPAACLVTSIAN